MFCPKCRTEYRKDFTTCADCDIPLVDELPQLTSVQLMDIEQRELRRKARNRFITSVIIAPLFAPLTMFIILTLYLDSIEKFIPTKTKGWLASFGIIMIDGAFVSYAFTIVIGLPLYLIFKHFNLINFWTLSIGGASVASLPFALAGFFEGNIKENSNPYLVLAACGFVVGSVFYLINNWEKTNMNAREGR